jgi:uncharacterized membrane protein
MHYGIASTKVYCDFGVSPYFVVDGVIFCLWLLVELLGLYMLLFLMALFYCLWVACRT